MKPILRSFTVLATLAWAAAAAAAPAPAWVTESNANATILLKVMAKYRPESATRLGLSGYEDQISDFSHDRYQERRHDTEAAISELRGKLAITTDPRVRQDIDILIDAADRDLTTSALDRKYFFPYYDPASLLFGVTRSMLDPRTPKEVRARTVARLEKYAGLAKGYRPLTELQRERTLERLAADPKLIGPYKGEVEQDLTNVPLLMGGMKSLLEKSGLKGWQKPYAALEKQVTDYYAWVRADILPKARADFRLPPEVYANSLRDYGIDIPPDVLVARALTSFAEIRNEMQSLSMMIAAEHKLPDPDYRAVLAATKKEQIPNDKLLEVYKSRLAEMEKLIREHHVVTLPERQAVIRVASLAESAQQPAPHMQAPQLIDNTGQYGEFVLSMSLPPDPSGKQMRYDDFSSYPVTWTLIAHEARPGHELQFAHMVEGGVSLARAIFAFNSVNAEGWALYAEAEMKPYEPLDGQLWALWARLQRAARAFLDPMLNEGKLTPQQVTDFLEHEVVLSPAMARQEVERYMFRAPGQATSYFYGYQRLMQTREEAQLALGDRFDREAFNDFVLDQGLLPPDMLEKAVLHTFVPEHAGKTH